MARTVTGRPQGAAPENGKGAEEPAPASRPGFAARLRWARSLPRLGVPIARQHWLMVLLLAAGLALRVISQIAYRPALLYIDSLKYLYNAWPGTDPLGYKGVLQAILLIGNLQVVTAIQHLVGLAMGVTIYALLLRRGVPRWLAALAAAPVLLDAYELQMEQTIMPDVWFEALMVAGLAVLLWRPRLTVRTIAAGGAALGLSATVWQGGEFLIVPAIAFTMIATGGWRPKARAGGLMCVAFAVPILLYMSGSLVFSGHFWLSRSGTTSVYGRVAEAANCATLTVPSYERVLCPDAAQKALGPDGLDHAPSSPLTGYQPPNGLDQSSVVSSFTWSVVTQQPLRVLSSIGADAARLFEVTRVTSPGDTPVSRWQFQTGYPGYQNYIRTNSDGVIIVGLHVDNPPPAYVYQPLDPSMGGKATVIRPLASFLRTYQLDGGYTPGPLYLFATVAGLAGSLFLIRRRKDRLDEPGNGNPGEASPGKTGSGTTATAKTGPAETGPAETDPATTGPATTGIAETDPGQASSGRTKARQTRDLALACCLFFITPVVLLLASDIPEFSWRYQLPAIMTLPPAGALGVAVILAQLRSRRVQRAAASSADGSLVTSSPAGGTARTGR
jgi:hypothetical protein